ARRKGADWRGVWPDEKTEQTVNRGSVSKGSPRATGVLGPGNRYGPCAGLSSRGGWVHLPPRVLHGALVRLERSAVKVARCVLRGLGEGDLAWLPGDLPEAAPSWYTGRLWLLRVGYYKLTRPKEQAPDWVWIIDHTVQMGVQKCLVILGIRLSVLPPPGTCLRHEH